MITLPEAVRQDAESHAEAVYPQEACGLYIVQKGKPRYWPCRNVAEKPEEHFDMDPQDYARAEDAGSVLAVVHSHPNRPPQASQGDLLSCEETKLPWFIVGFPTREWNVIEPSGFVLPLEGREFVHGLTDCYTLVRDWYAREMGLLFPNFHREATWWDKGQNLYLEHYAECGFACIPDWEAGKLERGDILLMQVRASVPNHAAVYLGDNLLMHHLPKRLSCVEPFLASYRKLTTHALRRLPC